MDPETQYHSYTNTSTLSIQVNLYNLFTNPVLLCFKIFCIHKCSISFDSPNNFWDLYGEIGLPGDTVVKNLPANTGDVGSVLGWDSPGGGNGNPLQYSCLKHFHGQRSLAGYNPCGRKESNRTEETACTHACNCTIKMMLWIKILFSFCWFGFGYAGSWLLGGLFSSVESGVWSVVVVQGLRIMVACLVAEDGLHSTQRSVVATVGSELAGPRLSSTGSIAVV